MRNENWMDNSSVRQRLTAALTEASASGKALANFMLANISNLPFETSRSVADKVGVSELTVGRFCRSIGYDGFKDLKERLKDDISDSPWLIGDRLRDLQQKSATDDALARSLELAVASVVRVYEHAHTEAWNRAAKRIAEADRVFVAGFQTERGLAESFVHMLRYLRDEVQLVDIAGGNFAEVLLTDPAGCTLVLIDVRRYSRQSQLLAAKAAERGMPITIVTDLYCDWAASYGDEVFAVPTDLNLFWDATSGMWTLMQLLLNSVFAHRGPAVEERLNSVASLYESFVGYSRGPK
ncbi:MULTISPECIES: MurR/RpiR family transcriptional regulator [unclassified Shinella]|jgi:DNA-binding MurR/RpiR family transcriptional regulator|uniref:MurR/RpiR family transcriptional regulator n=2 Tax=Shinella TaxID=323620 RepID=UPI00234E3DDB|nr:MULTISPECIES: MurR/RpiR family transcriptional regulator [unclassified Shinella]MCA0345290.1 MurR/RpiR family transcriptional regulator [Pseudomonadota bacterium]MDG4675610.1 MurR/RpiR family transcriptional regulator [Shinella sp. 838]